jgi:hypothetical protein
MSVVGITLPRRGSAARPVVPGALRRVWPGIVATVPTMRRLGARDHAAAVRQVRPADGLAGGTMRRLSAERDRRRESSIPLRRTPGPHGSGPEVRGMAGAGDAVGRVHGEGGATGGRMGDLGTAVAESASLTWIRPGGSPCPGAGPTRWSARRGDAPPDPGDAIAGESVRERAAASPPRSLRCGRRRASVDPARGRRLDDGSHGGLVRHRPEGGRRASGRGGDRGAVPPRSGPGPVLRYNRSVLSSGSVVARGILLR